MHSKTWQVSQKCRSGFVCIDTWTRDLGYFPSLPYLAIKTGDVFELSFMLPRQEMS